MDINLKRKTQSKTKKIWKQFPRGVLKKSKKFTDKILCWSLF